MRLFRVCPDAYNKSSPKTYKPEEGIFLSFVRNVPCLTSNGMSINDTHATNFDILPVILKESTKKQLQVKIKTDEIWSSPVIIKFASLHKSSEGVNFIQQEIASEEQDVLVSLELPLSAAQPYYEFEGDVEVLLGKYTTYYGKQDGATDNVEKENALCSAIIRMGDKAKVSFVYTNRYGQGKIIENLVGYKFEFICSGGQLLRFDDYNFEKLFSNFVVN
ncbi:hypothetical protein [Floridanema aerugineum]|uniref:Uncharacterized protein n=1 Tax=Floridaenema aerugineum BLCC-F46 TaxID=3153654 RepID=A0ABV4XG01_9CYAN